MKTIGSKVPEDLFSQCEIVREDLGINQSEYVRKALLLFNSVHFYRKLSEEGYPVRKAVNDVSKGQTEPSEGPRTCETDSFSVWGGQIALSR